MSVSVKYIGNNIENIGRSISLSGRGSMSLSVQQLKSFKHLFRFLNKKDRDILYLIFVSDMKQKVVQNIMNRSQPSLCYDIKRIKKRIQFIKYIDSVSDMFYEFLEKYEKELPGSTRDVMTAMFYTTSLTQASEILKKPQVKIRMSFDNDCLDFLKKNRLWHIYEIFITIRKNLNIIRRTYKNELEEDPIKGVFLPV